MCKEKNNDQNDISLIDCAHWVHECNRYLFLAKVHVAGNGSIIPRIDGDPLNYIETIINISDLKAEVISNANRLATESPERGTSSPYIAVKLPLKTKLSEEEVRHLRQTFGNIRSNDWNALKNDDILWAQAILCRLLEEIRMADRSTEG